jgi:hypothetical protein
VSEQKERNNRFGRIATKGVLGGLSGGFLLYLAFLFFRIAINAVAGTEIVPASTELGGFALGFATGVSLAFPSKE